MKSVSEMLEKTVQSMEGVYNGSEIVGNRPHYPVMVFSNLQGENYFEPIKNKIKKMWPQVTEKMVYSSYVPKDGGDCSLADISGNEVWNETEFCMMLDTVKQNYNTFAEMGFWCLYNLISTHEMKSLEDFKKCYAILPKLQKIAVDKVRSLAIILLDDSILNRELAKEIREYLHKVYNDPDKNKDEHYNGIVVISTRAQNDVTYSLNDLLSITANLIVVSNNDAIGAHDDIYFQNIVNQLYGNKINTIANAFKDRPNKNIALQIYNVLIEEMKKVLSADTLNTNVEWQKELGIYAGKITYIDDYLKRTNLSLDLSPLKHLPLRSCENVDVENIQNLKYSQLMSMTWEDTVREFVKQNIFADTQAEPIIDAAVKMVEDNIVNNITVNKFLLLDEKEIDYLFSQLNFVEPDRNKSVYEYIKDLYIFSLQKDFIIPRAKEKITELLNNSMKIRKTLSGIVDEFNKYLPTDGFADLGNLYKNMADSYLSSDEGKECVKRIISPNSTLETIIDGLYEICNNIINLNKHIFSLSFIEELEKRLNNTTGSVYSTLMKIIDEQITSRVYLHGNFAINDGLDIYLFRTHKNQGGTMAETDLFTYFSQTFANVPHVQFLNSGSDDSLEVIKLVELNGSKLIL